MKFEIVAQAGHIRIRYGSNVVEVNTMFEPMIVEAFKIAKEIEKGKNKVSKVRIFKGDILK